MVHSPIQNGRHTGIPADGDAAFAATERVAVSTGPDACPSESEAWLASLPMPLCTRGIAQVAPDIANRIAAAWSDVSLTSTLLEQLLIGDGVARLPPAVTSELLRLYEYNARCRINDAPDTTWELPASRHQGLTPMTTFQGDLP